MANYSCQQFTEWFHLVHDIYSFTMVLIAVITIFIILIAVLNVLILASILRTSNLQTPSNILLCNLAVANIGVAFIAIPSGIAWKYLELFHDNHSVICSITLGSYIACAFFNGGSYLTLILAAIDRYLALVLHLRYPSLVTNRRMVIACGCLWLASLSQMGFLLAGDNIYYIGIIVVIAISLSILVYCYFKIYTITRRHHKQIACEQHLSSVNILTISKRFRKSVLNLLYITCSQLGLLTPYFISMIVLLACGATVASLQLWTVSVCVLFSNSFFNPLVICARHGDLRSAIRDTASHYWSMVIRKTTV